MFEELKRLLQEFVGTRKSVDLNSTNTPYGKTYAEQHTECVARDFALGGWHDLVNGYLAPGFYVDENGTVIDVGCSDADHSHFCLSHGVSVVFTDIDPDVVDRASTALSETLK